MTPRILAYPLLLMVVFGANADEPIGIDDNPPYRVFYDVTSLPSHAVTESVSIVIAPGGKTPNALSDDIRVGYLFEVFAADGSPIGEFQTETALDGYAEVTFAVRVAGDHSGLTTNDDVQFGMLYANGNEVDSIEVVKSRVIYRVDGHQSRKGRNPRTGETITIPASHSLSSFSVTTFNNDTGETIASSSQPSVYKCNGLTP